MLRQNQWLQGMELPQDIELTAAAATSVGQVGYIDSSGRFALALATGTSTIPALLAAVDICAANKGGRFRPWGVVVNKDWSWTAGNKLYLSTSTAGSLTSTAPTTYIQPVAVALSATAILLFPSMQNDYTPNTQDDDLNMADAKNIAVGSTTGTKIATATSQKLGFFGATPVDKPGSTEDMKDLLVSLGLMTTGGATPLNLDSGTLTAATVATTNITLANDMTVTDAGNIILNTTTGTQVGTASTQKLGFLGATPVTRQANTADLKDAIVAFGLVATGGATPLNLDSGTLTAGTVAATDITLANDMTITDAGNVILNTTTGSKIATATTQKLGFWNATPIVQPSGASQAAVTTFAAVSTYDAAGYSSWGFSTSTQANSIVTCVNAMRTVLVNTGLMKGSA